MTSIRKLAIAVSALITTILCLFVASVNGPSKLDPADIVEAATDKRPSIRVLGEDSSNLQAIESLYKAKPYAGAQIEFNKHSFEDALQKANLDFAQGTGLYDIVLQYNFSLSSFSRNRYVLTVDELKQLVPGAPFAMLERDFFPNVWEEIGWYYKSGSHSITNKEAIGYPFAANTMLLVMNRAMFADPGNRKRFKAETKKELAPPKTWDDFYQLARFFTNKDKGTYGVCLQGQQGGWLYYEWTNFLFGMGGTVMNKERGWGGDQDTQIEIDSPIAEKAADFYVGLRPFNAGDFLAIGASEQKEILLKGNTAMAIVWSDYLWGLVNEGAARGLHFDFTPIPGGKSMIAGGSFYINRKTKDPRAAAEYVLDLLGQDNQQQLMLKGLCSPVQSAYQQDILTQIPYASALREALLHGVYMLEAGPDADAIQAVITEQLQRLWQSDGTARERLEEAKNQIQERRRAIWAAVNSKE